MNLTPRLVAIQGIGFGPIEVAVQGLLAYIRAGGKTIFQDTDQGVAGKNKLPERNWYVERANAEFERKSRLQKDDQLACEFIMTLVQMEFLDG